MLRQLESLRYIDEITLTNGTLVNDSGVSTRASNYAEPTLNRTNAPVTTNVQTLTVTIDASSSSGLSKSYDGTESADDGFSPAYTFSG